MIYEPPKIVDVVSPEAQAFNGCSNGDGWFNGCSSGS
jgi:hypothetical protein